MDPNQICPHCETVCPSANYFCPNCGKKLKDKPLSTSAAKQIAVYLISFFLPPFGLGSGIKYLKQEDGKSKAIGGVAILLTIMAIIITILITINVLNSMSKVLNGQLNPYGGLGL